MNKYYVIRDCQGGEFGMHRLYTLKDWRENAMNWADSDESYELYNDLKNYKIKNSELIEFISEFWDLEIKELENINEYIDFELSFIPQNEKNKYLEEMVICGDITKEEKEKYIKDFKGEKNE